VFRLIVQLWNNLLVVFDVGQIVEAHYFYPKLFQKVNTLITWNFFILGIAVQINYFFDARGEDNSGASNAGGKRNIQSSTLYTYIIF
jgi:Ni/Fe-hydrogenase subunit HybB-like protein